MNTTNLPKITKKFKYWRHFKMGSKKVFIQIEKPQPLQFEKEMNEWGNKDGYR